MNSLGRNTKAPEFCLPDQSNKKVCLSDFKGKWIIVYFYPKDNTTGCTIEAKEFTKLRKEFEKNNAVILGVSKDSCDSHKDFTQKHELNLILLSDKDLKVHKIYNASATGRKTYLISPNKTIMKFWENVIPTGHASEVLDAIKKQYSDQADEVYY